MNLLRKWWVLLLVIFVLAGIGVGARFWMQKNAAPEYRTSKIEKGAIVASVSATGTLSAVVSVQVGSQVSGQLKEIYVDYNSEVKQGQLIAQIDPETFEYKLRQTQADLEAARSLVLTQLANINAQRAEVSRTTVNMDDAKRDYERKQELVEKGFISSADRDKAQATYRALVEQLKIANAQVALAEANYKNAEAVVKQREASLNQAKIDLDRTRIRAPVNGIVIKRSVEKGQTVAASLQAPELFIIAENLVDMQVDTAIDESEIGRIQLGQKATFTVDAFPGRVFEGSVQQMRKSAQNVSNVVTYTVEVSASNPKKELLPGMTANVRIVTDTHSDVLKVSNTALRFKPAGVDGDKTASTSGGQGAANSGGVGGQMRAMRERLEKDLQLTADQKAKLDTIYAGMKDKFAKVREAPEAERQKIAERNRNELQAQIAEMLTPDQKKKYAEINAEMGDRRNSGAGGARGKIYTLDENRMPKAINVRLGLSDGTMTEVASPDLKEGMEIILGVMQPQGSANKPAQPAGPRMF